MAKRREFSRAVKAEIVLRATNAEGVVCCEGCGLALGKKKYQIDHIIADGLVVDKSAKLTAKEGQLLGLDCCHNPKSRLVDVPAIAKAKRREARDLGITRPSGKLRGPAFPQTEKAAGRKAKPALPPRMLFSTRPQLSPAGHGDHDD